MVLVQRAVTAGLFRTQPVLIVARRLNVEVGRQSADDLAPEEFDRLLAAGEMMADDTAMDVFIWSTGGGGGFSQDLLPPFSLGRAEWDKWLLGRATRRGFAVVDATALLQPVHLTDAGGNFASRRHDGPAASDSLSASNRELYAAAAINGSIDSCVRISCASFSVGPDPAGGWALVLHEETAL